MKIRKYIGYILYNLLPVYLPETPTPIIGNLSKNLRVLCAKLMLEKCGKNINIEKGAQFSTRTEIEIIVVLVLMLELQVKL